MTKATSFGARSTADQVLAGIDLTGKNILVTGCTSGIGFETASALAANGAHVIAVSRTLRDATDACQRIGYTCSGLECDLADLESVAAAGDAVRQMRVRLDAIVANAGVANLAVARVRYGVEENFLVNHLGHFALINDLAGLLRDGSGRVVIVSSAAAGQHGTKAGIMFDNLDGRRDYRPAGFYDQSKFAAALYAKELARRLQDRGIIVNAVNPGRVSGTRLNRHLPLSRRLAHYAALPFPRRAAQGAATIALVAASPKAAAVSGEYWQHCAVAPAHPRLTDAALSGRLWQVSENLIAAHLASRVGLLARAA